MKKYKEKVNRRDIILTKRKKGKTQLNQKTKKN